MAQKQIQNVGWWHERLADWMITNPDKFLYDAAKFFNCSAATISIIKNSDSFKEYWAQRSAEAGSMVAADVKDRLLAVTEVALENISNKMEREGSMMDSKELVDISNMGLKNMGYSGKGAEQVVVHKHQIDAEALEKARARMKTAYGLEAEPPSPQKLEDKAIESTPARSGGQAPLQLEGAGTLTPPLLEAQTIARTIASD